MTELSESGGKGPGCIERGEILGDEIELGEFEHGEFEHGEIKRGEFELPANAEIRRPLPRTRPRTWTGGTVPRPLNGGDRGSVTIEAAIALAALATVLIVSLAGVACVIAQVRCADAAREAARLAGRGDGAGAAAAVAALAPDGATLKLGGSADLVVATVVARPVGGLLPGITISASASAAREPAL